MGTKDNGVGFSFSEAKKCSNGGRALMQLDFTQFLLKFEKISGLRPVPHREYVENYVKAYYLPETELEVWIREHKVTNGVFVSQTDSCFVGILIEASLRSSQLRLSEQQEDEAASASGDRRGREEQPRQIVGGGDGSLIVLYIAF